jgi:hypothetical protein
MDEKAFKEVVKKIKAVNAVLREVDPVFRETALELLRGYLDLEEGSATIPIAAKRKPGSTASDPDALFTKFSHDKPADNVRLIAAFFYSQYGVASFSAEEVRDKADAVGLTVPNRPDMTLRGAKVDGRALFTSLGKGQYKPTVHGELYFKEQYSLTKGTRAKPETPA